MNYMAYYRVSTHRRQGVSSLGLDAQRAAIEAFIADHADERYRRRTRLSVRHFVSRSCAADSVNPEAS